MARFDVGLAIHVRHARCRLRFYSPVPGRGLLGPLPGGPRRTTERVWTRPSAKDGDMWPTHGPTLLGPLSSAAGRKGRVKKYKNKNKHKIQKQVRKQN